MFYVEAMPNGLTFIRCRRSGLSGCYCSRSGAYHHGGLALTLAESRRVMGL